jgi:hypothetical protein
MGHCTGFVPKGKVANVVVAKRSPPIMDIVDVAGTPQSFGNNSNMTIISNY